MGDAGLMRLPAFEGELLNAIIETPMGARNKFIYDEKLGLFRLKKVLPAGFVFPFHFGFVPSTWAEDDGPLDVLVLMEEPAFPGCLVPSRLLGAIEAEQTKLGKVVRNSLHRYQSDFLARARQFRRWHRVKRPTHDRLPNPPVRNSKRRRDRFRS